MTQLTNIAFIRAQKGRGSELGNQLLKLVAPSRAEPGCIGYIVHRSNDDPDMWCVYENWRSADDLTAHFGLPLVEGNLDLRSFTMVAPAPAN